MQVQKVNGCCSMLTISEQTNSDLRSKATFLRRLIDAISKYNQSNPPAGKIEYVNVKTVILISNETFPFKFWLKKAYSYRGNVSKARVYYVNFKKGL